MGEEKQEYWKGYFDGMIKEQNKTKEILREIVGEEKSYSWETFHKKFEKERREYWKTVSEGHNQKRLECINIIKDNNIEL